jgi:hypothetical protein
MTHVAKAPLEHEQFKDRSTGLLVFGVIALLAGALSGCVGILAPMALAFQKFAPPGGTPPPDPRAIIVGAMTYLAIAALFIVLGNGSIRAKRWVRPVMLSVGWTWLIFGIVSVGLWLLVADDLAEIATTANPSGPRVPASFATMIVIVSGIFLFATQVVLPAAFILFYRSEHVRATLADRDPRPSWTDQCPVPVLTLSVGLAAGAVGLLMMIPYAVTPAFGMLLTGAGAVALLVVASALTLWMAWATYKLQPIGWWGTLALLVLLAAAIVPTFARIAPMDFYVRVGLPPEQAAAYRDLSGTTVNLVTILLTLAGMFYMFKIRRHFRSTQDFVSRRACSP